MAVVSVVMPTCDRPKDFSTALESVLAQTADDLVVLVGDYSETNETERLVAGIDDPRIRYHRNSPGRMVTGSWLDLVKRVETPFMTTLAEDCKWDPKFLEELVAPLVEDAGLAMSYCDFWLIDDHGRTQFAMTEQEAARSGRSITEPGAVDYDRDEGLRLAAVDTAAQPGCAAVLRTIDVQAMTFPSDVWPLHHSWATYQLVARKRGLHYVNKRLSSYRVPPDRRADRTFNDAEDALYRRIIDENMGAGSILGEIESHWDAIKSGRGTGLMDSLAAIRPSHQRSEPPAPTGDGERSVSDRSGGLKAALARAAGRIGANWDISR